jgi:hypothetical protein
MDFMEYFQVKKYFPDSYSNVEELVISGHHSATHYGAQLGTEA